MFLILMEIFYYRKKGKKMYNRVCFTKRIALLIVLSLILVSCWGCSNKPEDSSGIKNVEKKSITEFTVGTSTSTGSVYQVLAGISQIINPKLAENGITLKAISSNGGPNNIQMMADGEGLFAAHASVSTVQVVKGELEGMEKMTFMRGICGLYPSVFHVVTKKGSGIESLEDLRGTKGSPGPIGGSIGIYVRELLSMVDITTNDYTPIYLDTTGMVDNVRDGHIDWAMIPMAVPSSWVVDLTVSKSIDGIVPISGKFRDDFLNEYPHYVPYNIPGGTYSGIPDELETAAVVIGFYCHEDAEDEVVYNITKAIWENLDEIKKVNAGLSYMTEETIVAGLGCELHPGAEKYWKEIGILK